MYLAINGTEIPVYPAEFAVTILDLDDADGTYRTADGRMNRERVAVKRQIEIGFNAMLWENLSSLLRATEDEFFNFTYPDPLTGRQATKIFYVGDRQAAIAVIKEDGQYWWEGLRMTLTEQ